MPLATVLGNWIGGSASPISPGGGVRAEDDGMVVVGGERVPFCRREYACKFSGERANMVKLVIFRPEAELNYLRRMSTTYDYATPTYSR